MHTSLSSDSEVNMRHAAQDGPTASRAPEAGAILIPQPKKVSDHLSPTSKGKISLAIQMKLGKTLQRLALYCHLVVSPRASPMYFSRSALDGAD